MTDYIIGHMGMHSGSDIAQSKKYHKVIGKSGKIWLYADQDNAGDNIYVEGGKGSNGFGGRTLTFELVDGSTCPLTGPWHTNSQALLQDTGVDLTNKHLTFGVIGLGREWKKILDVIYQDKHPIIGAFDRIKDKAQQLANSEKQRMYYYSQSQGGSSQSWVDHE